MTITIEGRPEEIAALALELQERRRESVEFSDGDTDNLVAEHYQTVEAETLARIVADRNV